MRFDRQDFLVFVICFLAVFTGQDAVAQSCTSPPDGLVSWWPMDGSTDDIVGSNNPSAVNALSFVSAIVADGVSLGSGGFIDIPDAANLANQQFTIDAWVRPDGVGPNNDQFGNAIINKALSGVLASAVLTWRATDNRFLFLFGDIHSERIISANTFPPGQFYHVAATYDGATFKLYVDGVLEGQFALVKTITYDPAFAWTIGATPSQFRPPSANFPRTWNGVIDEVGIFNRALTGSEIQAIVTAGSACAVFQALSISGIPIAGNQTASPTIGVDFDVINPITISALGAFDADADGISEVNPYGGIGVFIYDLADTASPLATVTVIGSADPLMGQFRFKDITPLTLSPGNYTVVAWGFDAVDRNGNEQAANIPLVTDNGGGLISFVNSRFSGLSGVSPEVTFPTVLTVGAAGCSGQPEACFAGGSFKFTNAVQDTDGDGVNDLDDLCPLTVAGVIVDADGCADYEVDTDGDGICDSGAPSSGPSGCTGIDNCPVDANNGQEDADSDGVGDACDTDDDNDGLPDGSDNCPLTLGGNADQTDTDMDGAGDICDADLDGDGVDNIDDVCPNNPDPDQTDTDGDLAGDACDINDDGDDYNDVDDNCPLDVNNGQEDLDGDNIGDACDADLDGDGVINDADNCPITLGGDGNQTDTDLDGEGDVCDIDDDNDSILDGADNCPLAANTSQGDADGDGVGDACNDADDADGDDWSDALDNCPNVANGNQADFDGDMIGDACDPDIDGDGVDNGADNCAATPLGELSDASGCTIAQLCPCDGPQGTTSSWKNRGKYVSCVAHAANNFRDAGLITDSVHGDIVSEAGQSSCGNKN